MLDEPRRRWYLAIAVIALVIFVLLGGSGCAAKPVQCDPTYQKFLLAMTRQSRDACNMAYAGELTQLEMQILLDVNMRYWACMALAAHGQPTTTIPEMMGYYPDRLLLIDQTPRAPVPGVPKP